MTLSSLTGTNFFSPLGQREFAKYQALGNDYLGVDAATFDLSLTPPRVVSMCRRNYGVGSDGLLVYEGVREGRHHVKIVNPDGRTAERSGNGLRIFARFLYDFGYAPGPHLALATQSGPADAELLFVENKLTAIRMAMGTAQFGGEAVHLTGSLNVEAFPARLSIDEETVSLFCCSMGNPHAVVIVENLDISHFRTWAPKIEQHPQFKKGINVQFAKVINQEEVEILIWERGAHETAASGSSSCAVASVLRRLGKIGASVRMKMPGGTLEINVDDAFGVVMTGPAEPICRGQIL